MKNINTQNPRRESVIIVDRNIKGEKISVSIVQKCKKSETCRGSYPFLWIERRRSLWDSVVSLEVRMVPSLSSIRCFCMISWSNRPPQHIHVKMRRVTFSLVFLYLSDSVQLGADLQQLLFAVLQSGLESLILMQSFCIHLKRNKQNVISIMSHILFRMVEPHWPSLEQLFKGGFIYLIICFSL